MKVEAKDRDEARAMLSGMVYEEQKSLAAKGIDAVLTDVRARIDRDLQWTREQALWSIAGSALLLGVSMAAWVAMIGSLRRNQGELNRRVAVRAAALTQAVEKLRGEIADRVQIEAQLVEARDAALETARHLVVARDHAMEEEADRMGRLAAQPPMARLAQPKMAAGAQPPDARHHPPAYRPAR